MTNHNPYYARFYSQETPGLCAREFYTNDLQLILAFIRDCKESDLYSSFEYDERIDLDQSRSHER